MGGFIVKNRLNELKNVWVEHNMTNRSKQFSKNVIRYVKGTIKLIGYLLFISFRYVCRKTVKFIRFSYRVLKWIAINGFLVSKSIFRQLGKIIVLILFDGFRAIYDQFNKRNNSLQENLGRVIASGILLWSIGFFGYSVSANTIQSIASSFGNPTLTAKQQQATVNHIKNLKKPAASTKTHTNTVLPNGDYMQDGVNYVEVAPLANSALTKNQIKAPSQYQNGKLKVVDKLFTNPINDDEKFINSLVIPAQVAALSYGVNPSVVIAQAYVESNHGKSTLASKYKNYFGIKYNGSGQKVSLPTNEETKDGTVYRINADFQVYNSLEDSMAANTSLLRNGITGNAQRYSGSWVENTKSYMDETQNLTQNYATATEYGTILNKFIQTYGLYVLDAHTVHNPDLTASK